MRPTRRRLLDCRPNTTHGQWVDRSGAAYRRRPRDASPNTTHGSGWIVQVQPTPRRPDPSVLVIPLPSRREGREGKTGISGVSRCRLDLNDPPTAVGGIPGSNLRSRRLVGQPEQIHPLPWVGLAQLSSEAIFASDESKAPPMVMASYVCSSGRRSPKAPVACACGCRILSHICGVRN
jgi:hypothetical protein